MKIGCLREIKKHEYRVGMTPHCVRAYRSGGHEVFVETGAGVGSGYEDDEYKKSGAKIVKNPASICSDCKIIIKVKEPLRQEYDYFHNGQIIYTYFHFAANKELTQFMTTKDIAAIAYETIELEDGSLPCLTPMSEIAGRLSVQEGAKYLEKEYGGRGILLGGVPGVQRGTVGIMGGGVVGSNACKIASGIGANVIVLDINAKRLAYLDDIFGSSITTLYATNANIEYVLRESDILIGAVLIHGESTPKLITREDLKLMKPGAVIVDVSVDQGGFAETSRPTTHDDPIYIVDGIVHYCVSNMPGAVARSSTIALTSVTLPFGLQIASKGIKKAAYENTALAKGINFFRKNCIHPGVAKSCNIPYTPFDDIW